MARTIMSGRVAQLPGSRNTSQVSGVNVEAAPSGGQQTQIDPGTMIDNQRRQIHQGFVDRNRDLLDRKVDDATYTKEMNSMKREYEQRMAPFGPVADRVKNLQALVASGQLSEQAGLKAQWSLLLPRDAVDSMFPDAGDGTEVGGPISYEEVAKKEIRRSTSPTFIEPRTKAEIEAFEDEVDRRMDKHLAATDKSGIIDYWNPAKPGGFGQRHVKKISESTAMGEYFKMRDEIGYTKFKTEDERADFDRDWDAAMADKDVDWNIDSPRIKNARDGGTLAKMVIKDNWQSTGEGNSAAQSYFANILGNQAKTQTRKLEKEQGPKELTDPIITAFLKEADGDIDKARAIALKRGYKL